MKAWSDACQWNGKSRVVVPQGTFKLYPVIFSGPCNGPIAFVIRGTLKATTDQSSFSAHSWINFRYVDELRVSGGGTLDGQGASAWHLNNCKSNPQCQALPIVSPCFFSSTKFFKRQYYITVLQRACIYIYMRSIYLIFCSHHEFYLCYEH